jgi:cell division protein FtsB
MTQQKRKNSRIGLLVLFILLIELLILASGRRGFIQQWRLQRRKKALSEQISRLEEIKNQLETDKVKLTEPDYDPAYIEKLARELYGMARENEMVFQVVPGDTL